VLAGVAEHTSRTRKILIVHDSHVPTAVRAPVEARTVRPSTSSGRTREVEGRPSSLADTFTPKPTAVSKPTSSKTSQTDWPRVDALEDDDIDYSDIPEVTPEMFSRAVVRKGLQPLAPARTKRIALRLDAEVLDWFKAQGRGYQERINSLLRAYMEAQRRR
jgi:uncharacterized protein (DUF4415 family)